MSRQVSFNDRIRWLIRYRYPLLIAAALNGLFLVGVPIVRQPARTEAASNEPSAAKRHVDNEHRQFGTPVVAAPTEVDVASTTASGLSGVSPGQLSDAARQQAAGRRAVASRLSPGVAFKEKGSSGLGRTVWQIGATAAAMSHWYQTAEKRDPFTEMPSDDAAAGPAPFARATPTEATARVDESGDRADAVESQTSEFASDGRKSETGEQEAGDHEVVLINQADRGFPVAFVARRRVYILEPGASLRWVTTTELAVSFDRGGDFGSVTRKLKPGRYAFTVSDQGWTLEPAASSD